MARFRPRSELWVREDILSVLKGLHWAHAALAANMPASEAVAFQAGFSAALRSVAAAFDVPFRDLPRGDSFEEPIEAEWTVCREVATAPRRRGG
jgi:hypothetical protein